MDLPAASTSKRLKWWFWIFLSGTVIFMICMRRYLLPLTSAEIVQFEMAKTYGKAASMISEWKENGRFDIVVRSINIDYIFIALYTTTIAIACRFFSGLVWNSILKKAGIFFSFFIFAAGLFDVAENLAMMKTLGQSITNTSVGLTYKMAISKFSIILVTLFFIAICFISWLVNLLSKREKFWTLGR